MTRELHTYRDLRLFFLMLPIDHPMLDQPIQAIRPTPDGQQLLLPVTRLGPIVEQELPLTVSSYNGEHEADDWVLILDANSCCKEPHDALLLSV
jgi:hypothetical protein